MGTYFVHKDDLRLEGLEIELRGLISSKWIIGDYVEVGGVFREAAENLGFVIESNGDGTIKLITNPDAYNEKIAKLAKAWEKHSGNKYHHINTFADEIANNVKEYREHIAIKINDIIIKDYNDKKSSGKYAMYINLLPILADDFDQRFTSTQSKDYDNVIALFMHDNEPLKRDLQWIIDGMTKAGYEVRLLTTPDPSIKLEILLN